ncbi:MAG: tRNA lysidine(34) synthetase TilS [Myxococcota bacterium]|nr:tRNA lysidine(34) synthetase TilS [Myxococcota bacterium]
MPRLRPETLPMRVLDVVSRQGLWRPGQTVLVAVSGGLDSIVLLDVLCRTARAHGGSLSVQSLDHGLRPEATLDVDLSRSAAAAHGVPFATRALSIPYGPDLMARARAARHACWTATQADRIALGHHADDQAETVLQRLARGSGARGLAAMRPLHGRLCRPLLFERKATLLAYAKLRGLKWREDPSNPSTERGVLRALHDALESVRPGPVAGLARSARLLAEEDAFIEALTDRAAQGCRVGPGLDFARLQAEPRPLAARILLRWVAPLGHPVSAERLEALLRGGSSGGALELGGGWCVVFTGSVGQLTQRPLAP